MSAQVPDQDRQAILFAGDLGSYEHAVFGDAHSSLWRCEQVPDVYAAAVRLLASGAKRPSAVLVAVESLRSDEIRFFDLLARRWPSLSVAVCHIGESGDRRLEVCYRKGLPVLSVQTVAGWLAEQVPSRSPPAARHLAPERRPAEAEAEPPVAESAEQDLKPSDADLRPAERIRLTPWSSVPRPVQRRRPAAAPTPRPEPEPAAERPQDSTKQDAEPDQARGLLTSDELRALLGDIDDLTEPQEDQS